MKVWMKTENKEVGWEIGRPNNTWVVLLLIIQNAMAQLFALRTQLLPLLNVHFGFKPQMLPEDMTALWGTGSP
jgi:hypothetical protein